ncbi:A24 family peptidase [Dongia mobilis]|uniref:A24 family peptidase n=1 Tax=Dongia mobilis TaxID=578943 RepID=UPI001414D6A5|nr:prepilin peptidase [Dongia mobilis]
MTLGEACLALLLLLGAAKDVFSFRLPNWLTLTTAAVALVLVALSAPSHLLPHAGFGLAVFLAGLAAFHFNLLGGGDIKWIAALALWIGPHLDFVRFLLIMGLAGGVLAGIIFVIGRLRPDYGRAEGRMHLPYGVAIAAAGLDFLSRRGHLGQELIGWFAG